jgi:hypothetical protein
MTKTAEEIFTSMFAPRDPQESALRAMEAYAAQEVEAYKARLKVELSKRYEAKILQQVEYSYIEQLIDAVK